MVLHQASLVAPSLAQQLVDACSSAAEKLGVTIKRAEELVRWLGPLGPWGGGQGSLGPAGAVGDLISCDFVGFFR